MDEAYVYWTSNLGNAVLRAAIGGASSPQVLYSTDTMGDVSPGIGPTGIAVDGENVYWSSSYGISAAPKTGNGAVRVLQRFTPDVLEQDDTHLYALAYGLDQSQALAGTIAFSVAKSDGALVIYPENIDAMHAWPIAGVAIGSNTFVYEQNISYQFVSGYPGSDLYFMTLAGALTGGTWLPPNINSPRYLVIDGCHGFVTDVGTIYRFTFDGQAVYPATTLLPNPLQMVIDDVYLYWVDGSGFVRRIPK